jgi:formylmethanofuran dehydrogenase subunit E
MDLKDYCKTIPDFALYLTFAKSERRIFYLMNDYARDDLYQIISESILSFETLKERNLYLKRQLRHFASRVFNYKEPAIIRETKSYYYKAKSYNTCDLCNKESNHYHYKSFIPDKLVCRLCYNKIKRQDKKRNS